MSDHQQPEDYSGLSDSFLEHAITPQNLGILPNPDGFASPKGACGDFIELYLKVNGDVIEDARFMTEGCMHTVACGSALTSLIKGRPLDKALEVGAEDIETELGGLEKAHRHCAALAAATLKGALRNYYKNKQVSWKGLYERKS